MLAPDTPALRIVLPIVREPPFQIEATKPVLSQTVLLVMFVAMFPSVSIAPPPKLDAFALKVLLTTVKVALPPL